MYRFNKIFVVVLVTIVLGLSGCIASGTKTTPMAESHNPPSQTSAPSQTEYGTIEIGEGTAVPTVAIKIAPDPIQGWNLELLTQNFKFAPEHASLEHYPGEGHAHLYIDGVKIARIYGLWYHIKEISPGQHVLTVTLTSNDHNAYTVNNQVISASTILLVK